MSKTQLQRLIFSAEANSTLMPLYAEGFLSSDGSAARVKFTEYGRTWATLPAHGYASFATYFNAFAASYWFNYTTVRTVSLRVKASGQGRIMVFRSSAKANCYQIESVKVDGKLDTEFQLPLSKFRDGGWYWLEAEAGNGELKIESAEWLTEDSPTTPNPSITIAITTFNRAADCVRSLRQISNSDAVAQVLNEVVVVDQGNHKVEDEADFPEVAERLGSSLRIINQANLGGSGGFSRGMYESIHNDSDYVILLDDDVRLESESIARGAIFSSFCPNETIVGGHMFSMYERTLLHAYAEAVELRKFWWGPIHDDLAAHDFALSPLRTSEKFHELARGNYNGWWMCMIPTSTVKKLGLSLPFFIKWDDSEYGLRAAAVGVKTVSLPGMAVWHVPWTDKDDSLDWQAYFHQRNRMVAALIHSPSHNGIELLKHSFSADVKHLLSQQYSVVAVRQKALKDVLSGPRHLHASIETIVPEVRRMKAEYSDAQMHESPEELPAVSYKDNPAITPRIVEPGPRLVRMGLLAKGVLKAFLPVRSRSRVHPEMEVKFSEAEWAILSQLDSAVVSNSDGSAASVYHRDPKLFKEMLAESVKLHRKIFADWRRLQHLYRDASPDLVSEQAWEKTLGLDSSSAA
ncbi:glycosyltransferase [Boudabousia marimammalium]|uniref:Uncharacterized protein n=1 Tax=Boudabousia marimammalium TaxID=156892 RepID=A0A1Q5PS33_9ACTO|nr:glycosyltransferase [Boudabousia marimammalium]OKL50220.1 hypothetical protein BM477_02165 [Boudabousia marimammalium]